MTQPTINTFPTFGTMLIHKYERYLPTAFDESMTLLEKVNKVIEYLNQIGQVSNDVITQWNSVMTWVMGEGLAVEIDKKLDEMVLDGTLDTIINQSIFTDLNNKIGDRSALPSWLQESLYEVSKIHDDYLRQGAINICQPPYNAVGNALYQSPDNGLWYRDSTFTNLSTPISDILNQAIADAIAQGKNIIYIPSGFYALDKTILLKAGIQIIGAGMYYQEVNGTVLRTQGDITAFSSGLVETSETDMRSVHLKDFLVSGANLVSSENRVGFGINATHMRYNVLFSSVGFKYFKYGMFLNNVWKARFHDVLTNYCETGIYLDSGCNRITFYDCEFNRNTNGVKLSKDKINFDQITFFGCLFENNTQHGAWITNLQTITFLNNYFEGNTLYGIFADGETTNIWTLIITGNRMYGISDKSKSTDAIYLKKGVKNAVVHGNYMESFSNSAIKMDLAIDMICDFKGNQALASTPLYSYVDIAENGYKPFTIGNGYFDLKKGVLRNAGFESFYYSELPTTDNFEGRIVYDLSNHRYTVWNGTEWKAVAFL